MTTTVTKNFNSAGGADFSNWAQLKAYVTALDPVASDTNYVILFTGTLVMAEGDSMKPQSMDATRRVTFKPAPGQGVNDAVTTTFDQGSTGAALSLTRGTYGTSLEWIDIEGIRFLISGSGTQLLTLSAGFRKNRIYDTSTASNALLYIYGEGLFYEDNLYFTNVTGKNIFRPDGSAQCLRNTFVTPGGAVMYGYSVGASGSNFRDNVFVGFDQVFQGTSATFSNNFTDRTPTSGNTGAGLTVVAGPNNLLTNDTNDFRPKAGGALIGAASASAVGTLDIKGGNRGAVPDVGAWQLAFVQPSPTGGITNITVSGTTVTISGTTTNSPTSGAASLTPTSDTGNNGVAQTLSTITLGAGTFTATFTNVKVGRYTPAVTLTNGGGTAAASNTMGNAEVTGATGTITSESLDGQVYTVSGTTTGTPTAANITIPAATTNPNGATSVGPTAMTLGSGTFSFTTNLTTGNYGKPELTFTTAAGTSFPVYGGNTMSVIGISGNPQSDPPAVTPPADTTNPVMTGTIAITNVTTSGFTLGWTAATDNASVAYYELSTNGGTSYTNIGNVTSRAVTGLTANTPYSIKLRAVDTSSLRSNILSASQTTLSSGSGSGGGGSTAGAPSAPTNVIATVSGSAVAVAFTAPASNGGAAISSYVVTASSGQTVTGTVSPISVALPVGTTATFTVHAVNSAGPGLESAPSNSVTLSATPDTTLPVLTGVVTITALTSNSATASWSAATDNAGISHYAYSINNAAYVPVNVPTVNITGLQPDTVYTISVRAYDTSNNISLPLTKVFTTAASSAGGGTAGLVVKSNHPRVVYVAVSGFSPKKSAGFTSYAKPRAIQDPNADLDYVFDWTDYLATTGSTIAQSEFFISNGVVESSSANTKQAAAWVKEGTLGRVGILTNRITTNDGRVDERSIQIKFKDQ